MEPRYPDRERRIIGRLMGVTIGVIIALSWQNFTLRQQVAELSRPQSCPTSPVNCPTPDWFTGRSDQQ